MLKLIVFDYKIDSTLANFFTQNVASYFPGLESIDSKFFRVLDSQDWNCFVELLASW